MSELFVVGISWQTAPVAIRETLAFAEDEIAGALRELTAVHAVAEAVLISTCNRVEIYGVGRAGRDAASEVREFLATRAHRAGQAADSVDGVLYAHRAGHAIRHVFKVASALDSLVVGEAQILGQLKDAYATAGRAGTTGPLLGRALERAFGVAKRVRTETAIARGAANVSSVAVELATRVFGSLEGKRVLIVGAGKMSSLAARHLYSAGAEQLVVTNRSPERADALAAEIDGLARPWADLEHLLADADIVISSTGARQPVLTRAMFKRVAKARRWRPMTVIDIAVPRDAEPEIAELDGVYLFDIDDLDKVVKGNLAERGKAAEHAAKIVEHEAGQFEQWLRSQGVVPTIRALRERFAQVAEAELTRTLDALGRREPLSAQQREAVQRAVSLLVAKLLHQPTAVLRASDPDDAAARAAALCALFDLTPKAADPNEPERPSQLAIADPLPDAADDSPEAS